MPAIEEWSIVVFNVTNATYDDALEDYVYDINESFSYFDWAELAPVLIFYGLTFVLGLIGNSIMLASTLCPRLRPTTPTNVFFGGLAMADLLLIIFCVPVKVAKLFSFTWTMGNFLCKAVHYMQSVSAICSVFILTAVSIERYYAIVHPMRAQYTCTISQARKIVIMAWIAAFLLGIPKVFVQIHKQVGERFIAYWCVRDSDAGLLWQIHEVYMLILVLLLPLTIMTFCYTTICWEIWRVMKRRYDMTSRHALQPNSTCANAIPMKRMGQSVTRNERRARRDDTNEESRTMKQVVKMLVATVLLFALCWGPVLVENVLTAYGYLPRSKSGTHKHLHTVFQLMSYLNSCINPIVYGLGSKHFRKNFMSVACRRWWRICCPRRGYRASVTSLNQARSTSMRWIRNSSELHTVNYL